MINNNSVLILGAKSQLSKSIARKFSDKGFNLVLAGRNISSLTNFSKEIKSKNNINCILQELDILNKNDHDNFFKNIKDVPDIVICVVGLMQKQNSDQELENEIDLVIKTNYLMPVIFIEKIINKSKNSKSEKTIIGISSVAGERGRASNYIYGSSKSGFTEYLSGLRQKFSKTNINIITIKPGYIRTKMTENISGPDFLFSSTESVANLIYQSYTKKKLVVYTSIWKYIMVIIRIIPEKIFRKLNL